MDLEDFTNSQKTLYVTKPKASKRLFLNKSFEYSDKTKNSLQIPFITLNNDREDIEATYKRWLLYNDMYLEFHNEIDTILENSNKQTDKDLKTILMNDNFDTDVGANREVDNYKNVFLVGADNSFKLPKWKYNTKNSSKKKNGNSGDKNDVFTVIIEILPSESPNIRMMTKRTMFQLLNKITDYIEIDDINSGQQNYDLKTITELGLEYDLSIIQNFEKLFKKNLKIIFNYKDLDLFNFQVLDDWINTIYNLSVRHCDNGFLEIINVFQINTNLSNIEKNLKTKTIRILKNKGNYHILKINDPLSLNIIINKIFQKFLQISSGKLIFSSRFISDIIIKLKNSIDSKKKLIHTLIKILDYSLMSYFYSSPFAIFLDIINFEQFFDESYAELLIKCPSFIKHVDEMLLNDKNNSEEIKEMLTQENSETLKKLFVEMLVKPNPITQNLMEIIHLLENDDNKIFHYNIFEVYYHLSIKDRNGAKDSDSTSSGSNGSLKNYFTKNWPSFLSNVENLKTIDKICNPGSKSATNAQGKRTRNDSDAGADDCGSKYIFHELFTLDNKKINGIISQNLFPSLRGNMEENILNPERLDSKDPQESHFKMMPVMNYPINYLFTLYREAGSIINVYDFYAAFKSILPKQDIVALWERDAGLTEIHKMISRDGVDLAFDKVSLIWFMQCITDMKYAGILKNEPTTKRKYNGIVEKAIWRGL